MRPRTRSSLKNGQSEEDSFVLMSFLALDGPVEKRVVPSSNSLIRVECGPAPVIILSMCISNYNYLGSCREFGTSKREK